MNRRSVDEDQRIAQEMWTLANNEPLSLAPLQPFGVIDRDRYRRDLGGGLFLELTLEPDPRTGVWSYEFAVLDREGGRVDQDVVDYWLQRFFGNLSYLASKRSFLLAEARFTFPHHRSR